MFGYKEISCILLSNLYIIYEQQQIVIQPFLRSYLQNLYKNHWQESSYLIIDTFLKPTYPL